MKALAILATIFATLVGLAVAVWREVMVEIERHGGLSP